MNNIIILIGGLIMNIETKKWEVLCSEEQIASRFKELGAEISKDYEGKKLLVVSLLKGSFIFCADLVRNITVPVKIEFMTTSSYGHGERSTGNVKGIGYKRWFRRIWRINSWWYNRYSTYYAHVVII